jgi:Fe-S cluster biosynthesis and repair protein YggX
MVDLTCIRCGETREGLDTPPYPDEMGQQILQHVCSICWEECKNMQVMVINEYRLDLSDPRAQEILERSIRGFLQLEDGDV